MEFGVRCRHCDDFVSIDRADELSDHVDRSCIPDRPLPRKSRVSSDLHRLEQEGVAAIAYLRKRVGFELLLDPMLLAVLIMWFVI